MSKKLFTLIAVLLLILLGAFCAPEADEEDAEMPETTTSEDMAEEQPVRAVARLEPTEGNSVEGTVMFEQENGSVRVTAHITGLEPGAHGFHIHETGDCSAADASSAGGHFAPEGNPHGGPDSAEHHAGDLGNIEAGEDGNAHKEMSVDFISLEQGTNSIIGKAVIVHAGEDDLTSQPSGDAGARQACGVVETDTSGATMREGS